MNVVSVVNYREPRVEDARATSMSRSKKAQPSGLLILGNWLSYIRHTTSAPDLGTDHVTAFPYSKHKSFHWFLWPNERSKRVPRRNYGHSSKSLSRARIVRTCWGSRKPPVFPRPNKITCGLKKETWFLPSPRPYPYLLYLP